MTNIVMYIYINYINYIILILLILKNLMTIMIYKSNSTNIIITILYTLDR